MRVKIKSGIKCPYFFDFTSFLEARAEILTKISLVFWSICKQKKEHFEIIKKIKCSYLFLI